DRGHDREMGGARLLAGACDRRLLAKRPEFWIDDDKPKECLRDAWRWLHARLCRGIEEWDGAVTPESDKAGAIARAGMGTYCDLSKTDRKHLFSLFDSAESVIEACATVIESDLDLKEGALPREFGEDDF